MRTYSTSKSTSPTSTTNSTFSLISSLDSLSLDSRRSISSSSGIGSASASTSENHSDDYEIIPVPKVSIGKSAKRRERARKIRAAEAEGRDVEGILDAGPSGTPKPIRVREEVKREEKDEVKPKLKPLGSGDESEKEKGKKGKKTRRSGVRYRTRMDKAQIRDTLLFDGATTPIQRSIRDSTYAAYSSSEDGIDRDLDEEDEDEVDGLSVLSGGDESEIGTPVRRMIKVESELSVEDARSSIDDFLTGNAAFVSDKSNKLRLWQSLCIELGLVHIEGDPFPDVKTSTSPSSSRSSTPTQSRSSTPKPPLPPLPQSLTQARNLLKANAHINIVDYFKARETGQLDLSKLLYPNATAMIKDAKRERKMADLSGVKGEWLEPLLKDFGFKKGRARRGGAEF